MDADPAPFSIRDADVLRRLAAERAFHDRKFGESKEHRGAASIYDLPRAAYRDFERRLQMLAPGADILEYGCGDCSYVARLSAWGGKVTAIDISEEAIRTARGLAVEGGFEARFACMNAEALSFADDSFDLIVGRAILHHLDLDKALPALARVLRPGGTAIFLEPLGHNPLINLYRRFTPHLRTEDEHPLLAGDIALARRHFGAVALRHYTLLSMGALAFAKIPALWTPALKALDALDRGLFRLIPIAGRWAWTVSMEMRGPRKV